MNSIAFCKVFFVVYFVQFNQLFLINKLSYPFDKKELSVFNKDKQIRWGVFADLGVKTSFLFLIIFRILHYKTIRTKILELRSKYKFYNQF